eukprot:scaffold224943_cov30-Tisochrysis_lutea.AAC.3
MVASSARSCFAGSPASGNVGCLLAPSTFTQTEHSLTSAVVAGSSSVGARARARTRERRSRRSSPLAIARVSAGAKTTCSFTWLDTSGERRTILGRLVALGAELLGGRNQQSAIVFAPGGARIAAVHHAYSA